jgi:uncharacterized membrane protein YeaQ/YmgE (transglycosylase-associated protein family)
MGWIISIIIGALIGWLSSLIMDTDQQQGYFANILVGIFGSVLGGWLFGNVLGIGGASVAGQLSFWGIIWGLIGAVVLIAVLKALKVLK